MIEFLTPGQKIKKIRKMLNMRQYDLQGENVKRNFISMIENGKRGLSKETAKYLIEKFNKRARELEINLEINESYLLMSQEEEARQYCLKKLNENIDINAIDQIIKILIKFNLSDIEAYALLIKGNYYFSEKDYSKALTHYVESLGKYSNVNNRQYEAYLYNKLGLCKLNEMYYTDALVFFNKAYSLAIVNNDVRTSKYSTYNIALCYRKLNNFHNAIIYIDEYLRICNKVNEFTDFIYANVIKANCLRDLWRFEDALEIYNYLLTNFNYENNPLIAFVYDNLGLLYSNHMEYDKALECLDASQKIRTELDIDNLAKTLIDKSSIFIKQKKYNEALILINLGIDMSKKYKDYESELKSYYMLIDIYKDIGNINELEVCYKNILNIIREKKDYKAIMDIYKNLCLIYINNGNIEKAKALLEKSLD